MHVEDQTQWPLATR